MNQILQRLESVASLLLGLTEHDLEAGHDQNVVGIAAEPCDARLHVGVEVPRDFQGGCGGKDHISGLGCKVPAILRGARLHQHGLALWGTRDIERAADLEVLAFMAQDVELGGIEEDARLPIKDEGIIVPTVPQTLDHACELAGAGIALVGATLRLGAASSALQAGRRCVQGSAGASAADEIERSEFTSEP